MKKLALSLLLCVTSSLSGATFHTIIAADTATKNVRESSHIDIRRMRRAVKYIAKATDMNLKLSVIDGKKLSVKRVLSIIDRSKVSDDDSFFFYYTGHGLGDKKGRTEWPAMHFKPKRENLAFEAVVKAIDSKNPRLTIIFVDSCNNYALPKSLIPPAASHDTLIGKSALSQASLGSGIKFAESDVLKALFRDAKGKILASASIRGLISFGGNTGGWFTNVFLESLQRETHRSKYSWEHVLKKTRSILEMNNQFPQYTIELES